MLNARAVLANIEPLSLYVRGQKLLSWRVGEQYWPTWRQCWSMAKSINFIMAIKSWRVDEWMVCHIFITSRDCEKFCVEFNFKEEYLNLVAVAGQWTSTGKYFSLKRNKQTNYALVYVVVLVHDTNIKEIIFVR